MTEAFLIISEKDLSLNNVYKYYLNLSLSSINSMVDFLLIKNYKFHFQTKKHLQSFHEL